MSSARGTSNKNCRGSSYDVRVRKQWLLDQYGDGERVVCRLCWAEILVFETVTADRIVPGWRGGRYVRSNIRPASMRCNSIDGNRQLSIKRAILTR